MLAALWESVATGWARAGGGGLRAGALEAALRPLGRSAREVPSLVAPRLQPYVPRLQPHVPRLQPHCSGAPQQLEMLQYHEVSAPRLVCSP